MSQNDSDNDRTESCSPLTGQGMVLNYRVVGKIGAGGMGEVVLADDIELKRRVALKFLPEHLCADPECQARFRREAQAAAALKHPNIVTIYQVAEAEGRPFIVMEYVEGGSLKDQIRHAPLPMDRILDLARQLCEALVKAHEAGIVHRDIKPSNVVMDRDGRPKLLDFGLAALAGSEEITKTGSTMGTVWYMSPEQIRGSEADARSDLYSFGTVLYELIAGRRPFEAESEVAIAHQVVTLQPPPLSSFRKEMPDGLQRVVSRLLEKLPDKRYQSAGELLIDLNALQDKPSRGGGNDDKPSIAVLPFTNLSADPEQEYFCDGMAEEMISSLACLEGVRVASRTSSFAYKGKSEDIRDIGHRLGVGHVLEGSVRKAGSRLRITAQLVNVADGYHLWSEKYDREMKDLFAIQDEISLAIVDGLRVRLRGEDRNNVVKRYTDSIEAYNLHLKSRHFLGRLTAEDHKRGIQCLREAIEIDPSFALAYVDLGMVHTSQAFWGITAPSEAFGAAREAVDRAVTLDPNVSEAHNVIAVIKTFYEWKWDEGDREFRLALEKQPDNPLTNINYGMALICRGQREAALEQARIVQQLDPLSLMVNCWAASLYSHAGDHKKAVGELKRLIEMDVNYWQTHYKLSYTLMRLGQLDEAVRGADYAVRLADRSSISLMNASCLRFMTGDETRGRELFEELLERSRLIYVPPTFMAWIEELLGNEKEVEKWLEKAHDMRDCWLLFAPILNYVEKPSAAVITMMKRIGLQ